MSKPELVKAASVGKGLDLETRTKALEVTLKSGALLEEVSALEMECVVNDVMGVRDSYHHVQAKLKEMKEQYDFISRDILHDKKFKSVVKPLPFFIDLIRSWDEFLKKFDKYLRLSLEGAERYRALITELCAEVFPILLDESKALQDKKDAIKSYSERLGKEKKSSEKVDKVWQECRAFLDSTKENWESFLNKTKFYKARSPYPADGCVSIHQCRDNIDDIHKGLKDALNEVRQVSDSVSQFLDMYSPLSMADLALETLKECGLTFNSTLAIRTVEQQTEIAHSRNHTSDLKSSKVITHMDTSIKYPDVLHRGALQKIAMIPSLASLMQDDLANIEKKLNLKDLSEADKKLAILRLQVTHQLWKNLSAGFEKYCAAMTVKCPQRA